MNVAELDAKLRPLLSAAVELQCELSDSDPDVELAVALGALSSVVVILQSLLPRETPPARVVRNEIRQSAPSRKVRLGCSEGCGFGIVVLRNSVAVSSTGRTNRACDRCGAPLCVWEYDG